MEELRRQVRTAQRRLGVQRFVGVLGWCCFVGLSVALVMIAVDKFWPTGVEPWVWPAGGLALGVAAAIFWSIARGRGPVDAAIEIDRRFGLKERVSSTLAMSSEQRDSEVGEAVIRDAVRRVERVDVPDRFPILPGKQLLLPFLPAIGVALVWWLVSPAMVENPAGADTTAIKKQISQSSDSLRRKLIEQRKRAKEEGLKDAQMLFQKLQEETEKLAATSEGDRKQALVKLNDLHQQMERRRQQLGGAEGIEKQLKRLESLGRGPAEEFLQAIAKGDFKNAVKELDKLKSKMSKGELSDEERKKLAEQLDQMQKKLQQMVENQKQKQQDLQNRIQQARNAGNKQEADQLQQKLDQMQQQMPQMNKLQEMASKLGQCSKCLDGNQLQDAGDLLDQLQDDMGDLQQQLQEMQMLDDAMAQLNQARDQMNCGL
jgi:chemotaxis protein histidine kinase CheA